MNHLYWWSNKIRVNIIDSRAAYFHMSRIGDRAVCSRCYAEKVIAAEFSGSDTERLYCEECYTDMKNCFCDICGQKLPCTFYTNHLQESHSKEEMAKLISDFKEKDIFEQ
jgi:hypothetical protein